MQKKILAAFFFLFLIGSNTTFAQDNTQKKEQLRLDNSTTVDMEFVNKRVLNKVQAFGTYLQILVAKKDPNYKNVIDLAMKLFMDDENVMVEVMNPTSQSKKPIRKYLVAMSQLPYASAQVKYSQTIYVTNIKKAPDGTYRGTVTLQQTFKGLNADGKPDYSSVDNKTFEIIIKVTEQFKDGKATTFADVFLGNIGIAEKK